MTRFFLCLFFLAFSISLGGAHRIGYDVTHDNIDEFSVDALSSMRAIFDAGNNSTRLRGLAKVLFRPGDFSQGKRSDDGNLDLSNGLTAKVIAQSGKNLKYANGGTSSAKFHKYPDGAAVFKKSDGGWYYVSNAENPTPGGDWEDGGVGSIEFNSKGQVVKYKKIASSLRNNCGGGRTPWNSWVTCEEIDGGKVHQVDPSGKIKPKRTDMGSLGQYESFAFDNRKDAEKPTFYVTRDSDRGSLTRFTPNSAGMACYKKSKDKDRWCTLDHGTRDYLLISGGSRGTFKWTKDEGEARDNAERYYPNLEGIDVADGVLFATSKKLKRLMILDLRAMTYTYESTVSGPFNEQPDQVARLITNDDKSILYFCEDGGRGSSSPGIFGRSSNGKYFTILTGRFDEADETTGLAFSPDGLHMYVAYQKVGLIYDVTRADGLPFSGAMLDIKYHRS